MNTASWSPTALSLINQLVAILYLTTTWLYGLYFFRDDETANKYKQRVLIGTVVVHVLYLGLLTSLQGYRLSYSTVNLMSMVGFTLTSTYLLTEFTTKSDKTGFFIIAFATGAQLISSILASMLPEYGNNAVAAPGIGVHLIAAIFSFSSIAIAGLYSALYLLMFREIRTNHFALLFQRLPSLEILEKLTMHAVSVGFLFLTVTLGAGYIALSQINTPIIFLEPKMLTLLIIWLCYGTGLLIKPIIGWDIKHMAILFISLFIFATILILFMTIVSPTFHGIRP